MKLFGYLKPYMDFSFSVPIYTDGVSFFYHCLTSSFVIDKFEHVSFDKDTFIEFDGVLEASVGEKGFFVFIGKDQKAYIGLPEEIVSEIESMPDQVLGRRGLLQELNDVKHGLSTHSVVQYSHNDYFSHLIHSESFDVSRISRNRESIFLACDKESLSIAKRVKSYFGGEADVDIWREDILTHSETWLSNIVKSTTYYDYAIFVFAEGGERVLRDDGTKKEAFSRLGHFLRELAIGRTFLMRDESLKEIAAFKGMNIWTYSKRTEPQRSVWQNYVGIRKAMRENLKLRDNFAASSSLAITYYANFLSKIYEKSAELGYMSLVEQYEDGQINVVGKVRNDSISYTVLIPKRYEDLELISHNAGLLKYRQGQLNLEGGSTFKFPVYFSEVAYRKYSIFLIPQILLGLRKIVSSWFNDEFLARNENEDMILNREILSFGKTMQSLLLNSDFDAEIMPLEIPTE